MRKVAVLFGGNSCENEISILTGVFVINVLDRTKYDVLPVYIHTDGGFYTSEEMKDIATFKQRRYSRFERVFFDGGCLYALNGAKKKVKRLGKIDVAINACHGGIGEGGGVSALMELNAIQSETNAKLSDYAQTVKDLDEASAQLDAEEKLRAQGKGEMTELEIAQLKMKVQLLEIENKQKLAELGTSEDVVANSVSAVIPSFSTISFTFSM